MSFPPDIFPNIHKEDFWTETFLQYASYIWLCFLHSVSYKALVSFKALMGPNINNSSSLPLQSVYCAKGLVLGDLHVFNHIFLMWIFYFTIVTVTFLTVFLKCVVFHVCPTSFSKVKKLF